MTGHLNLEQILNLLPNYQKTGGTDMPITTLTHDSRRVEPGALFICLSGNTVDGHNYIADACQKGAAAVIIERETGKENFGGMTIVKVPDSREAMQIIAPHFYGNPSQKLRLIGITGTNGKTTTSYLIRSILRCAGYKAGLIGTNEILIGEERLPTKNTTPDVADLQEILAKMVDKGMEYVVMEVSSHALKLKRVAGCEYDLGVFTNITQDHLDFHLTFEDYLESKGKLFAGLGTSGTDDGTAGKKIGKTAVINIDDQGGPDMLKLSNCRTITYGVEKPAELTARNISIQPKGVSFDMAYPSFGMVGVNLKITGLFNVYNTLAAVGAALAENIEIKTICRAIEAFTSVRGRFELVDEGQPFTVIVDYAHTPDGLENVLKTAGEFAGGRIIAVFGCGGDRDKTKRPIMGRLAVEYADIALVTSDNPRTEDPAQILKDIEDGIKETASFRNNSASRCYEIIPDRREAIRRAIIMAKEDDTILILGKGHETYQILKDKTIDFDDREVARECIREIT